ncbi:hypothetical protein D3C72_2480100 [compost metagenome]
MIGGAFVFPRRIDAEHLREILNMDALAVCAAIEASDEQDLSISQRLKFLWYTLEL